MLGVQKIESQIHEQSSVFMTQDNLVLTKNLDIVPLITPEDASSYYDEISVPRFSITGEPLASFNSVTFSSQSISGVSIMPNSPMNDTMLIPPIILGFFI